jgi:Spy/CpxP family protein refolding chaperone
MQDSSSNSRRGFFRRAAIATLIGGIATGIGLKAWAYGGLGGWHRGGFMSGPLDPAMLDERIERMARHFAVEVDATPEQGAQLAQIAKASARELLPLREQAREARRRAVELLASPSIDRAALERLRAEQLQHADAASRRLAQALADVAEVLTPEQRQRLAERFRHARRWRHG